MKVETGIHSPDVRREIAKAWHDQELVVFAPRGLPEETIQFIKSSLHLFPEAPIFGVQTSGTQAGTLDGKLVFYSRRNLTASLEGILSFFDQNSFDSIFCYPQPHHVFGLVLGYLCSLIFEKELHAVDGPYSRHCHEEWLRIVSDRTLTLGTPTHFYDLLQWVESEGATPKASYSSIIGGAPVKRELWLASRQRLNILNPSVGYGASELSPGATHLNPGLEPVEDYEIGNTIPGVTLTKHPQGGMIATGPNVCVALLQMNSLQFPKEVWLRDELRQLPNGHYIFQNRCDLVLNRGGEKFALEKIENTLRNQLNVEAAAVSVAHPRLGQELALVVKKGAHVDRGSIYNVLRTEFSRQFESALYFEIDAIPMGATAKVDREACRNWILNHEHYPG